MADVPMSPVSEPGCLCIGCGRVVIVQGRARCACGLEYVDAGNGTATVLERPNPSPRLVERTAALQKQVSLALGRDLAREALELLRAHEFEPTADGKIECPECDSADRGVEAYKHRPDCRLARVLRELEEATK